MPLLGAIDAQLARYVLGGGAIPIVVVIPPVEPPPPPVPPVVSPGSGIFGTGVTLADIRSADWSVKLDTPGGVPGDGLGQVVQGLDDISQCLLIICTTPKGSDPLRPLFGADIFQYIDFPIQLAIPAIVNELTQAILQWEPRILLEKITASPVIDASDPQSGAHMLIDIVWQIKINAQPGQTTVNLPFGR